MNLFLGETSYIDTDVEEVASFTASSSSQKRKRVQVVSPDIIEIDDDDDDDTDEVVIIREIFSDKKNKQPMKNELGSKNKDVFPIANGSSFTKLKKAEKDVPSGNLKGFLLDPLDFSLEDYDYAEYEDDYEESEDNDSELEVNDYDMPALVIDKNNLNLAAQFDKLDLPPGVEATVPFMEKDASRMPIGNPILVIEDEINVKFKAFKQFDYVRDSTDHYFHRPGFFKMIPTGKKPGKDWAKRIQHEWKVLEKDLPDMIYVRIYEDRMDLLRAVIIGPAGTPYHDGLFFFDIYFTSTYPLVPPMVHYHSGGLRLNPNLYACGKVCLSLLNTWAGHGCEKWNPSNSTMLQVLVSIQALVLNSKPYFNEPGYERSANTTRGKTKSLSYNENIFILSCKTMLYSLRKPPKHFEDFVAGHFRNNGRNILSACRAYANGTQVGCVVGNRVDEVVGVKTINSTFKKNLSSIFELLLMEFVVKGADCQMFLAQKAKGGDASASKSASASSKAAPVTALASSKAAPVTASASSKAAPVTASASSKAAPVTASASSKAAPVTASASSKATPATASASSKAVPVTASASSKAAPVTPSASSKAAPVTASASSKAAPVTASASSKALPVTWWR